MNEYWIFIVIFSLFLIVFLIKTSTVIITWTFGFIRTVLPFFLCILALFTYDFLIKPVLVKGLPEIKTIDPELFKEENWDLNHFARLLFQRFFR